ncbi:hypothetical protein L2E82_19568 [Cichorium intybus]|uniref:Uncharacterized protein n=1 Tax=Cichorium intybus TaxID=13427 RepID=A0ACB9FD71_CICIN|nr:hypothetical protein L2E82_19568 [Cichorium intybus]
MLFIVSGWSNVKQYLYEVNLVFLKITSTVQVLAFVATIVIESNPTDYIKNVKKILLFVDFTACFTVLLWFSRIDGLIELGNATNEVKIMETCVQMLRVNAITETVNMIFYSLLFNGFDEYYVRVDQAAMFVLIKLNRQDVNVKQYLYEDLWVNMLRVNAITETVSMIFYSLLFNGFDEYYVRVDQAAILSCNSELVLVSGWSNVKQYLYEDLWVNMLRVNAITETVSMIFYSLLFNGFDEYYVRVDQAAMFVLIKLNRQDVDVVN